LAAEVADALRSKLQRGQWKGQLPAERHLCDELQISRNTLRTALEVLRREGRIQVAGRRRLIRAPDRTRTTPARSQTVILLGAMPLFQILQPVTLVIEEMQQRLHHAGLTLEISISPYLRGRDCSKTLAQLVGRNRAAAWILCSLQPESHQWFADRGLPAMVFGSCLPDIELPSVDMDYVASYQHAVDLFAAKGHRNIVLFCERGVTAGHRLSEGAFLEAVRKTHHPDMEGSVLHHDGSLEGIQGMLDSLFARRPGPTAMLVSHPHHVLAVISQMNRRQLRVPEDISLICHLDDPALAFVVPRLCRYRIEPRTFASKLARMAIQIALARPASPRAVRIMPQFLAGDSVSAAPHSSR
jgi:DNA-binding LacI/PurR family transcriptional regulator